MGGVDLHFVAVEEPTLRVMCDVQVDPGVAPLVDHHLGLELEVLELLAHVVQMTPFTVADNRSIFDRPVLGAFVRLPAT